MARTRVLQLWARYPKIPAGYPEVVTGDQGVRGDAGQLPRSGVPELRASSFSKA